MIHGCASMSSAGMWGLRLICREAGVPMRARRSQTAGSRLRGNDGRGCGNDVMGVGVVGWLVGMTWWFVGMTWWFVGMTWWFVGVMGWLVGMTWGVRGVYEELTLFS